MVDGLCLRVLFAIICSSLTLILRRFKNDKSIETRGSASVFSSKFLVGKSGWRGDLIPGLLEYLCIFLWLVSLTLVVGECLLKELHL